MTVSIPDMLLIKNLPAMLYSINMSLATINLFLSSSQPISLLILFYFYFLGSVKETPAYHPLKPEFYFSVL